MTGVLRPGHAQIRVVELDSAVNFYRDVLGLVETGRDSAGRVYFKAWDERDHNSVVLRQADGPGIDHFAFKVRDPETLDRLERDLRDWGTPCEHVPEGEMLSTGRRLRFETPSGHLIELYAEKEAAPYPGQLQNPRPWTDAAEHGIAPIRMDHCLLYGPHVNEDLTLFTEVLGFYLTEYVTLPDGITRGMTIYGFDPSGNRFETFCGGLQSYPDQAPIAWSWEELPSGLDYPQRKLHETFLTVVT